MVKAFRVFPGSGVVAIFDEAAGGGDPVDINSLRNRPALDPENWLPNIYFHSNLNRMEVLSDSTVTISHGAIAVATGGLTGGSTSVQSDFDTNGAVVDHEITTHSQGSEPLALVAVGNNLITPGYPVQVPATTNGSVRYITPWVTSTKLFLREFQSRGAAILAAASISYRIIIFRNVPAPSGSKLVDFDPLTGVLKMAKNRFDSSRRYLQVVAGGSPFGLVGGRTIDAKKGGYRIARADGTTFDPIPSTVRQGIRAVGASFASDSLVYGDPMAYDGTYTPSGIAQVQAP